MIVSHQLVASLTLAQQPPGGQDDGDWVPVEGLDRQTVELKRAYEAEVEEKVTKDHAHVVWAYGLIWAIFAAYGLVLWRRSGRLERDLADLRSRLDRAP
ncbi:MAG: hypothetical protein B7733_02940 [Myxococcales bacterium FL481]|nr:MAG: hypothetical protein B7733_02940 [Myxococcales bacterium FL481]